MKTTIIITACCSLLCSFLIWKPVSDTSGISFQFKGKTIQLNERSYPDIEKVGVKGIASSSLERYDTSCNVFFEAENYVEIIRQDDKTQPSFGIAIGFEFSPGLDTLPYEIDQGVMQLKDFKFGGLQFSAQDSFNHTGVVNEFSQDFILIVTAFEKDTIEGTFKGVLLNGAGGLSHIENGQFRVGLMRKN